jgi:membrane protein required for colicin V production
VAPLDVVVLALLAVAALRGLFHGLVRELFSLAGLVGAVWVARALGDSGTAALAPHLPGFPPAVVRGIAMAGIGIGVLFVVAIVRSLARRGAQAAGLGLVDRLGGGVLGAAEGVVVAALLLAALLAIAGRDSGFLARSRSLAAYDALEARLRASQRPTPHDVAAPPP